MKRSNIRVSNKIIISGSIAILLIGGVLGFNYYSAHKKVSTEGGLIVDSATLKSNSNVDSDHDGLPDWEEALWGTDPHNPDTNGDGIPDGEEVAEGKNPLTGKPLTPEDYPSYKAGITGTTSVDNTVTGQLSQSLFDNYMAAQEGSTDGNLDDNTVTQVADNALASVQAPTINAKYSLTDIKVLANEDNASIKAYGNNFEAIEQAKLKYISAHGAALKANPVALADQYASLADELSQISVPSALVEDHLSIINNYYAISVTFNTVNDYAKDPAKALLAIQSIQGIESDQLSLYADIENYFLQNGIIFNSNEAGYVWNNYQNVPTDTLSDTTDNSDSQISQ